MVRDVFMKVCKDEEKFEHSIALLRIGFGGAFFQVSYDSESVRKQPFQPLTVDGAAATAALQSLIRSDEGFVEEVIEAKLFALEGHRNRVVTRIPSAGNQHRRIHVILRSATGREPPVAVGRD